MSETPQEPEAQAENAATDEAADQEGPATVQYAPSGAPLPASPEEKTMGMLCHLLVVVGAIVPFACVIGPLIIWVMKKDQMPFVDSEGKEALNFGITVAIAFVICSLLMFVFIGFLLLPLVWLALLILGILATVSANKGQPYRYPVSIRLIK